MEGPLQACPRLKCVFNDNNAISNTTCTPGDTEVACRKIITDVLGGEIEFGFFHAWFNSLFLAASLVTSLLFYIQQQQRVRDFDLPVYASTRYSS